MSLSTGSPVSSFTSFKSARPFSRPGPRNDSIDVRLALSNDALKTRLIFSSSRSARIVRAIASTCSRDSITHGPAMKSGGLSPPKAMSSVMRMARVVMRGAVYPAPRRRNSLERELAVRHGLDARLQVRAGDQLDSDGMQRRRGGGRRRTRQRRQRRPGDVVAARLPDDHVADAVVPDPQVRFSAVRHLQPTLDVAARLRQRVPDVQARFAALALHPKAVEMARGDDKSSTSQGPTAAASFATGVRTSLSAHAGSGFI